jgi:hypothetical protein
MDRLQRVIAMLLSLLVRLLLQLLVLKVKHLGVPLLKRRLKMRNSWKRILGQWLLALRV